MAKIRWNHISDVGLLIILGLASSCGGGGQGSDEAGTGNSAAASNQQPSQTIEQAIQRADSAAGDARLDYGASLTGADGNGNGVRDDVDRYLLTLQVSESERRALTRNARDLQAVLAANLSDRAAVARASLALGRSTMCLAEQPNATSLIEFGRRLTEATFNTPERLSAYIRYDAAVSGTSTEVPAAGSCDQ